jgi:hypothetical protein
LSAFKRAYTNVDSERQQLQTLMEEADKQMNFLENQLKVGVPFARNTHQNHNSGYSLLAGPSCRHTS